MSVTNSDRIEKKIVLRAPRERVWRALTNADEFGTWFRVKLEYRWHPYAVDPNADYSAEPTTLVEFRLQQVPDGTMLTIVESGFDRLPAHRRDEAFRMNADGWGSQIENIQRHVAG